MPAWQVINEIGGEDKWAIEVGLSAVRAEVIPVGDARIGVEVGEDGGGNVVDGLAPGELALHEKVLLNRHLQPCIQAVIDGVEGRLTD